MQRVIKCMFSLFVLICVVSRSFPLDVVLLLDQKMMEAASNPLRCSSEMPSSSKTRPFFGGPTPYFRTVWSVVWWCCLFLNDSVVSAKKSFMFKVIKWWIDRTVTLKTWLPIKAKNFSFSLSSTKPFSMSSLILSIFNFKSLRCLISWFMLKSCSSLTLINCDLSSAILSVSFETSEKDLWYVMTFQDQLYQSMHTVVMVLNASRIFCITVSQVDVLVAILFSILQIRIQNVLKLPPKLFHVHFPFFCDHLKF